MEKDAVASVIRSFFEKEFRDSGIKIYNSMDLIKDLYIDSIFTIKVVFFLEKEFDIEINAGDVNKNNFKSIDTLTKFTYKKLAIKKWPLLQIKNKSAITK